MERKEEMRLRDGNILSVLYVLLGNAMRVLHAVYNIVNRKMWPRTRKWTGDI